MSDLERIIEEARGAIAATSSIAELEQVKARFLGKSGTLTEQLKSLGKLPAQERPQAGAAINDAKRQVEGFVQAQLDSLRGSVDLAAESLRLTLLRYQAGEATALEVVDAQTTVTQARNSYDDGLARFRLAMANLQTLTGSL